MAKWRGPLPSGRSTSRVRQQVWTDPRLVLGVLVVLGSTLLGASAVAAGDETSGYWAVRDGVRAGDPVRRDDLVEARARLDGTAGSPFLRTDEALPAALDQLTWSRDLSAGALVDRTALGRDGSGTGATELPLSVALGAAPDDLRRGDRVDVWVGPAPGEDGGPADRVLAGVTVVSPGSGARAAGTAARTVLVDVGEGDLDGDVVAALTAGHVTLVRLP